MAEAKFYAYVHRRADTGEVFYVGKGLPGREKSRFGRNRHWHSVVAKHGLLVEVVADFTIEAEALAHECGLIAEFRAAGASLVNMTDGGEGTSGFSHNAETVEKIRAANSGRVRTDEARMKMSKARAGRVFGPLSDQHKATLSALNVGRKMSPEAVAKMSAKALGRGHSQETKAKISFLLTGRPVSDETRAKLAARSTGVTFTEEHRRKLSESKAGKPLSDEHKQKLAAIKIQHFESEAAAATRAKLSEAAKRQWAARRAATQT